MSQIFKAVMAGSLPPSVPTSFTTDSGIAVPVANNLNLFGQNVTGSGIQVTGSGSTVSFTMFSPYSLGAFLFDGGNLSVARSNSGGGVSSTIQNTSNTASSTAEQIITVAGTSSGDPYTRYEVTGQTSWAVGTDTSDSQKFKINRGSTPSLGTNVFNITTAGVPAFPQAGFTTNGILYNTTGGVLASTGSTNRAVSITSSAGVPVLAALAVDGQLLIGSTAGQPAAATLTAGTGITITNASNSITIAVSGSGFAWTDVTGATQTLAVENGYITDRGAGVTYTLPATASLGDEIIIVGKLGLATITPNANQQILIGSASGTIGVTGTCVANNVGDCITLICITSGASSVYRAVSLVGNWTLT